MAIAGYLKDAKNQQAKLATNLTAKGVTASATEKYDSLVSKVAHIEELRGEERTLDMLTKYNDTPESIVSIEYPESFNLASNYKTTTRNGVTFTVNDDMSITVNGTNTSASSSAYITCASRLLLEANNSYAWDLDIPDNENVSYTLGRVQTNMPAVGTYTPTKEITDSYLILAVPAGKTVNNVTVRQPIFYKRNSIDLQLSSKNLWQHTQNEYPNLVSYDTTTNVYTLKATDIKGYINSVHILPNPIPKGTTVTITARCISGQGEATSIGGYHNTGVRSWQGNIAFPSGTDLADKVFTQTFTTTDTVEQFYIFHNTGDAITEDIKFTVQYELGTTATPYTPYISDLTSVNITACGKNLIPYPYAGTTKTINGITFTDNGDGTITANGTATANAVYELQLDSTMFSLPAGNYFLSGCPAGGSTTTYFMVTANGAGTSYDKFIRDFGNGVTVSSKGEKWKVSIRIMSGTAVNNLVFKPQLELGSTATPYEPYQGQTYTPTADGIVTGIQNIHPITNIFTDNAGVLITAYQETKGNEYFDILPSEGKNGITKVHQAVVDSSVDSNIKAENIKKDVNILGVTGSYEGAPAEVEYTYDTADYAVTIIF